MQREYYIPNDKFELVTWLSRIYPKDKKKFKRKKKSELYAIFYSVVNCIKKKEVSKREKNSKQLVKGIKHNIICPYCFELIGDNGHNCLFN